MSRWRIRSLILGTFSSISGDFPHFSDLHLEKSEDKDEEEQDIGHGRRVSELEEFEPLVVHVLHHGNRGIERSAFRHDVGFREELEISDEAHDGDETHGGLERGESDVIELLPFAGSVYVGGFIESVRYGLEPCQEYDHVVSETLPYSHQDERGKSQFCVSQPVLARQPEKFKEIIDESVFGIIEPPPDYGDCHQGRHDGNEVSCAEDRLDADEFFVDENGEEERNKDCKWYAGSRKDEGVGERFPEDSFLKKFRIVFETQEMDLSPVVEAVYVPVREAHD